MEYLIIGIATAFNFTVIVKKLRLGRIADAVLDCSMFTAICFLFSGTFGALATGAIASALISLYLLFSPFYLSELGGNGSKSLKNGPVRHENAQCGAGQGGGIIRGSGRNSARSAYIL